MLKSIRILKFPALLAGILLMVAGCSSSSGGGSGGDLDFLEDIFDPVNQDTPLAAPTAAAARATPREGSVTQSSDLTDAINVTITDFRGESQVSTVENTKTDGWEVASDSDTNIVTEFEGTDDLAFEAEVVTGGDVYVGLVTEPIGEDDDANYLAYGLWAYVPDSGNSEIGVFLDSNVGARFTEGNLAALVGEPTYTGDANGIYSDLVDGVGELSSFTGEVGLTALFGVGDEPGTISGTISDLRDIHDNVYAGLEIELRTAPIDVSQPGGFFTGATFIEVTIDDDPDPVTFGGNWGGQFFLDGADATEYPGNVAGTFGLTNTDGDNVRSLLGVFFADLDDDS